MRKEFGQDIKVSTQDWNDRRSGNERRQFLFNGHKPEPGLTKIEEAERRGNENQEFQAKNLYRYHNLC